MHRTDGGAVSRDRCDHACLSYAEGGRSLGLSSDLAQFLAPIWPVRQTFFPWVIVFEAETASGTGLAETLEAMAPD